MITNFFAENFAQPWGVLHILSIVVLVAMCAGAFILAPRLKASKNSHLIVLITVSAVFVLFEIGKQIISIRDAMKPDDVYLWVDHFPVVPCSIFMYVTIACVFFRNKPKVVDTMYLYLATYGLISGVIAYVYPNAILSTPYAFISIQTMIHHGLLIFIGMYLFATGHAKLEYKIFLKTIIFFVAICIVGMIVNLIVHLSTNIEINMMYINPWADGGLPIIQDFLSKNFLLGVIIYLPAYTLAASIVFFIALFIKKINRNVSKNNATSVA